MRHRGLDSGALGVENGPAYCDQGAQEAAIAEREVASIVWHEIGLRIVVFYVGGEVDRLIGSASVAATLAEEAGLRLVATDEGTHRWVQPETA